MTPRSTVCTITGYDGGANIFKGIHTKLSCQRRNSVPEPFNLDHLHPFEPLLFQNFSNFFTFILGGQFLLPQRANNGRWVVHATPEKNETGGFGCLGHSNWTICCPLSLFCFSNFPTFSLSYWGANSYYPRGLIMREG